MNLQHEARSLLRMALVALLPGVLAAILIILSFAAYLRTLTDDNTSWTGHAYQMLNHQIALVVLAYHEEDATHATGPTLEELVGTVRSSFKNRDMEFKELAQVEQIGPARLARVEELFEEGVRSNSPEVLHRAMHEANALNAQARDRLQQLRETVVDQTHSLQRLLTVTGALAAIALAAVIARFVDLWRREKQLRAQQQKLSKELSLMASHELRRPLQQLALVADLLQHDDLIGETERARLFQRLQDSAAQLAVLSDLSRLDAVYAEPELNRSAHDLAVILAPLVKARVTPDLPEGIVWSVDALRFRQAVENILENALKYSPTDVRLILQQGLLGPEVHIIDRGPGIPDQDRERVFEPFYRVPGGGVSGHGLGLAIARRFIRAHGGDITLHDEPGGGTRAVLELVAPHEERPLPSRARHVLKLNVTARSSGQG